MLSLIAPSLSVTAPSKPSAQLLSSTCNFTEVPHSVNKNLLSASLPGTGSCIIFWFVFFFFFFTPSGFYLLPFSLSFPFGKKRTRFFPGLINCTAFVNLPSWSMTVVKCYMNKAFWSVLSCILGTVVLNRFNYIFTINIVCYSNP